MTSGRVLSFIGLPTSEIAQNATTIDHFRNHYRRLFGAKSYDHALYREISEGHKFPAMEHWLPLFYEKRKRS